MRYVLHSLFSGISVHLKQDLHSTNAIRLKWLRISNQAIYNAFKCCTIAFKVFCHNLLYLQKMLSIAINYSIVVVRCLALRMPEHIA